jgi:tRNA G10  N-methylase Trm11
MLTYYFLLGSTPELSLRELLSVYSGLTISPLANQASTFLVRLESPEPIDAKAAIESLGGTVKIIEHIDVLKSNDPEDVITAITDFLAQQEGKVTFGLAEHNRDHLPTLPHPQIKKELLQQGLKVRYIEGSRHGLSAAVLNHHPGVIELNIIQSDSETFLGKTLATQDIDAWSFRDRAKPYADRKKGMLPPKVARIMVNLAVNQWQADHPNLSSPVLYDPFCGTGTILIEGLLSGCEVIGSDLDADSIKGTQQNLIWFNQTQPSLPRFDVVPGDVTQIKPTQLFSQVDLIVTEPFLGKPLPQPNQVDNIFKGLSKLYLGAFKNWRTLLNDGAHLVIIMPHIEQTGIKRDFEDFIDKLSPLGYTTVSEPVLYHRPQAVVQRQIFCLKFQKTTTK